MNEAELRKKISRILTLAKAIDVGQSTLHSPHGDAIVYSTDFNTSLHALLDLYRENEREIRLDEIKRVNSLTLSPLPITTSREIYIQKYAEQRIAMLSNTHKTGDK